MSRAWKAISEPGKSLADLFPEIAHEWHPEKNQHQPTYYKKSAGDKVWWLCSTCSHEWPAQIRNRTIRKSGCPACSGHVLHVNRTNSLLHELPEIARQLHPTKNGNLRADELMPGARAVVWWLCNTCENEWEDTVAHRKGGRGCPACSGKGIHSDGRNSIAGNKLLGIEFNQKRNPGIDPSKTLSNTKKIIWWRCSMCNHEWDAKGENRARNESGCPVCATTGFKPHLPAHYYVIRVLNGEGDVLYYKGGITNDLTKRFNSHKRKFSDWLKAHNGVLELTESVYFEMGAEAEDLEDQLLAIQEIRAPNIRGVSRELFEFDPLDYARNNGMI